MSTTARKRNRQGKSAASKRSKSGKTSTDEDVIMAPEEEEPLDPTIALIDLQRLLLVMEGESTTLPPHELRSRATYCRRLYDAAAQPDSGAFGPRVEAACAKAEQMAQEQEAKMAAGGKLPSNLVQDIFHSKPSSSQVASDVSPEEAPTTTTTAAAANSKAPASPTASSKAPVVSPPPNVAALQQNQREQMEAAVSQMATQMKEQTAALHATLQSQNTHLLDAVQDVTEENVRDVSDVAAATQQHVRQGWRRTAATWGLLFTVALATVGTLLTIQMVPKSQRQHQVITATLAELPCLFWCDDEKQATPPSQEETIEDVPDLLDESDEDDVPDLDDEPPEEGLNTVEDEEEIVPEAVQDDVVEESSSQERDERTQAEYQEELETVEDVQPQHEEQVVEEQVQRDMEPEQQQEEQEPVIPQAGASYRLMARSASHGRLDLVHKQLSRNPLYVHTQDDNGWALIHEAARAGYLELIEMLVEFGANLWLETSTGETPMDLARMGLEDPQHPAILYLESLMYPSDTQDEEPEYIQEYEAEEQEPEEVEEEPTEDHREPDSVEIDPSGNIQVPIMDADAMREAALREFEDMQSQASSSTGGTTHQAGGAGAAANANDGGDPFSSEAKVVAPGDIHVYDGKPFSGRELRRVASRGDSRRIAGMLEQSPEFIDQPDQNGWTALHLAVRAGHTEVVQHLLNAGADVSLVTQQGRSVMDMAILKFGSEPHPIIDMLEEYE